MFCFCFSFPPSVVYHLSSVFSGLTLASTVEHKGTRQTAGESNQLRPVLVFLWGMCSVCWSKKGTVYKVNSCEKRSKDKRPTDSRLSADSVSSSSYLRPEQFSINALLCLNPLKNDSFTVPYQITLWLRGCSLSLRQFLSYIIALMDNE